MSLSAILAAEDKRFFKHHGIDWLATSRAFVSGVCHGHFGSGASTITQQLVKIAEHRPRTLRTKIIEAITALRLEQSWSKDRILVAYLNRIDFGNLNIGLATAADYYFGKPVSDLSEAEAAFLAGLPKNPRKLNPHVAMAAARARQETVLHRMRESGALDASRYEIAMFESLRLRPPRRLFRAPHFVDLGFAATGFACATDPENDARSATQRSSHRAGARSSCAVARTKRAQRGRGRDR